MSASPNNTIFTEISRLRLTIEEKTDLRSFFTVQPVDKRAVAFEVLESCLTEDEKIAYIKTFLTSGKCITACKGTITL